MRLPPPALPPDSREAFGVQRRLVCSPSLRGLRSLKGTPSGALSVPHMPAGRRWLCLCHRQCLVWVQVSCPIGDTHTQTVPREGGLAGGRVRARTAWLPALLTQPAVGGAGVGRGASSRGSLSMRVGFPARVAPPASAGDCRGASCWCSGLL